MERKTGHSSDQWFKLKTKHQNNNGKHQRRKLRKQQKREERKQSGQIEVRGRSTKNSRTKDRTINDNKNQALEEGRTNFPKVIG